MKKLSVKAIKEGKWESSCTQLSDSQMNSLKGGGTGCVEAIHHIGWTEVVAYHPNHDYESDYRNVVDGPTGGSA